VAVADALEAMLHRPHYRRSRSAETAVEELCAQRTRQFDPDVVDAALRLAERRSHALARAPLRAVGGGG
jgi:HD-GYP domain-containing protein (c-di-GMP phosphodiesterase class II)